MTYRSLLRGGMASLCAVLFALPAHAQTTDSQPPADDQTVATMPLQTMQEIVVTAPHLVEPLLVVTDPKKPRIPVPAMDGGGYLKNIPGFNVTRKGGAGNDPIFRGQGASRLPMFMDGTNFGGACGGRMDASPTYVFPESYDKITVIKGPQSVRYGGIIAGGVLFDCTPLHFDKFGWFSDFSALYGSFARYDLMADVGVGSEYASIRGIATRSSSQNYKDGRGDAVHSRYRRNSGTIIAALTPDRDTVFQVTADFSDGEAAYAHGGMDGRTLDRKAVNILFRKENLSDLVSKVEARAWYSHIDHIMDNFTLRDINPTAMMPYMISNPNSANSGGRAEIELIPFNELSVTIGTNYDYEQRQMRRGSGTMYRTVTEAEAVLHNDWQNNMSFNRWGGFAEAVWHVSERSRVVGGYGYGLVQVTRSQRGTTMQASDIDVLNNGFTRYEHDVNVGVPVTLYAGLGYAQRAPDYWERTKNFNLKKERNTQIDVGAVHTGERWRASASLFASRVQDYMLINWVTAANSKNITAKLWGGELDAAWTFIPDWTLTGSLAYTYGQNSTDHVALAQVPPLDSRIGINYDDKVIFGGLQMRAVATQTRTDPGWGNVIGPDLTGNNARTGGFTTFSAYAGWKPFNDVTVALGVDNIFNKIYAEHISRGNAFGDLSYAGYNPSVRINEPGRTFWIKGQVKF